MKFYNYPININTELWIRILEDDTITTKEIKNILLFIYGQDNYESYGGEMARCLGYIHHAPLNRIIPVFSKRILKTYSDIKPSINRKGNIRYWHVPFLGAKGKEIFSWILRSELVEAIEHCFSNEIVIFKEKMIKKEKKEVFFEGAQSKVLIDKYERDKKARRLALEYHGCQCAVCAFDFGKTYGEIGRGKIHIHHKRKISKSDGEYELNPIEDLVPVCPNCHMIIHSKAKPFTIEEMKVLLKERNSA